MDSYLPWISSSSLLTRLIISSFVGQQTEPPHAMSSMDVASSISSVREELRSWNFVRKQFGWSNDQARLDAFILGHRTKTAWNEFILSTQDLKLTDGPTDEKLIAECEKAFVNRYISEFFLSFPDKSDKRGWDDNLGMGHHIRLIIRMITTHYGTVWNYEPANRMRSTIHQALAVVRCLKRDWSRQGRFCRLYTNPASTSMITSKDTDPPPTSSYSPPPRAIATHSRKEPTRPTSLEAAFVRTASVEP